MNIVFSQEFLDNIEKVVRAAGKSISRVEVCKRLGLPGEFHEAIGLAVKLKQIPGLRSKRGVNGGISVAGVDNEDSDE